MYVHIRYLWLIYSLKTEVEDKWLKNTIFHHVIILIISELNLKWWKMEDRNAFFVGKCLFTTGLHNTETFLIFCFNHF